MYALATTSLLQFFGGQCDDAFEGATVFPTVFAMQKQALGGGVVAISGGFVAPNILLTLEGGAGEVFIGRQRLVIEADVEQVLFDVFEQAVVVVLFLQVLVETGGVVAAEVGGHANGVGVVGVFGQNVLKCLSEGIGVIGFVMFVKRGDTVIKTFVEHADVAALQGEAETVAASLRNTAGTLQDCPLFHANRVTLRGLRGGNAVVVIIGAYRRQRRRPFGRAFALVLHREADVAGQGQRCADIQISGEPVINQPTAFCFLIKRLQSGLQLAAFVAAEIAGDGFGFLIGCIVQQHADLLQIALAGFV